MSPSPYLVLLCAGLAWGLTLPLTKIVVSTGHQPLGLVFWQTILVALILAYPALRGARLWPVSRAQLVVGLMIALLGTVLPNMVTYQALTVLPAGLVGLIISLVPLAALPIAVVIGMDRFTPARVAGVALGAVAMVVLTTPGEALPGGGGALMIAFVCLAPLLFACEGNFVAWYGLAGLTPIQALFLSSLIGAAISLPLALFSGQWVSFAAGFGPPEQALIALCALHAGAYSAFMWLIRRAGSVFASQIAYIVTAASLGWSILILSETYAITVWAAFGLILIAITLVRPQSSD